MTPQTLLTASRLAMLVGGILVVVGTYGAYRFGQQVDTAWRSVSAERGAALHTSVDEVLAGNQELQRQLEPFLELALLRYPTESLDEALESLTSDLDELRERTEVLEERVQPREITADAREQMLAILHPYAGRRVTILAPVGAAEAYQLTGVLRDVFQAAGWKTVRAQSVFSEAFTGIHIGVRSQQITDAARAVADAFSAGGLESTFGIQPALQEGQVEIRVGATE